MTNVGPPGPVGPPCPYPRCEYSSKDAEDLEGHLTHTPTDAPEHWRKGDNDLPRRKPGMFMGA